MAELSLPTVRVRRSFLAAMAESRGEGGSSAGDDTMIGDEFPELGHTWSSTAEGFTTYVQWTRAQALEDSLRLESHVPWTTLWWVDGEEYLGRIGIRHRLTAQLREVGGHIGYEVRPSARRRGCATAMLRSTLPVARTLGIESALLICDVNNVASRKVIERNGGILEDARGAKLRFWVPTS